MNKFETTPLGGIPFVWDDWRFNQNGIEDAFRGLCSAWGLDPSDSFVLSGCEVTTNSPNFDISEGYIALNGEVVRVDAHSVPIALGVGQTHFWEVEETNDPAGQKATRDAGTVETYKIRRGKVVIGAIPSDFMPLNAPKIHEKIVEGIAPFFGTWTTVDLEDSDSVKVNTTPVGDGATGNPIQKPQAGSYYKYSIVGKTVTFAFEIFDIRLPNYSTLPVASIIIENLPFTIKGQQVGSFLSQCPSHTDCVAGMKYSLMPNNETRIVLPLVYPINTNNAFYNRTYRFNGATLTSISATGATTFLPRWRLRGSMTFEIE